VRQALKDSNHLCLNIKVKMNPQDEMQELDAMEAELMADAAQEDARIPDEFENPAETVDIEQENIEPLVESSEDSQMEAEIPQNEDIADESANEETVNEELNEEEENVPSDTEDNLLDEENQTEQDEKPLSKRDKERARLDKSWQKQEAFKAENMEERERLQREREEFEKQKAEVEEKNRPPTAKEYRDLAKWYEEKGEYEKAEEAKNMADIAHEKEYEELQNSQRMSAENQAKFQKEFWETADKFVNLPENKELQDVNTPLGQAVKGLLEKEPRLLSMPDGFEVATNIARGQVAVSSLADANKRITELENEIKTLNKKTSIGNSGANGHNPTPSKRPQSLDAEFEQLQAEARREDARLGV